ncbi:zinc finger protein 92 [Parasteatoda tepidariorum]|uniref:zinc finger protein 92 n=1 Tax=Parasteatoda tepidariorum TaxID=114398 RepID=UPI00077FE0DE|nr:gastrula zinc finger protein XlCGF9.1 [Parasteatoda tepidariorum]XP_015929612.1 gastrula zinc finger protein XlCGF9.1 [Parasteatoda tepidariorum]XP_015929613.1 gastrula zinc finger protein XlCGF9.1 [Parasteatoda tepidariorum]XP_042895353.1 gastrula zinc finger protein XlCGF9.1 [Parasteatoda tepidariorum]
MSTPLSKLTLCTSTFTALCPTCGTDLKVVKNLDAVSLSQNDDLQYDCLLCGYRYSYEAGYAPEELGCDTKSTYCSICDKQFNQTSSLKRHMLAHSADRPFCCKECDKTFKTKAALKRHEIIHTGECPFECSTCKRKFNQISNLRKHLVIHNNKCPFYCDVCGKGFNQLSNLKKHMVVHPESNDEEKDCKPVGQKTGSRPLLTFIKPAKS